MISIGVPLKPSSTRNYNSRNSRKSLKSSRGDLGPDKNDFWKLASFIGFLATGLGSLFS